VLWAALEAGPPVWLPALSDIASTGAMAPEAPTSPLASPPSTAPAVVIGDPVTHEEAILTHGEEAYLEALEDEDMGHDVLQTEADRWERNRNGLIALQLQSISCNCPNCSQIGMQAATILSTGDLAHTLLGDATPVAAPVVEYIVGSAQLESSSPAAEAPATTPVAVRCEREYMERLLLDMAMIPVVVHEASDAEDEAPTAATVPETSSSSSLPDTVGLPEAAANLHDMD